MIYLFTNKFFTVSLIPHTSNITTLGALKNKDIVNLEVDILARYVNNNINNKK